MVHTAQTWRRRAVAGAAMLLAAVTAGEGLGAGVLVHQHLCTLRAAPWDTFTRVRAPEWTGAQVAADGGATFQVTYNGFTQEAQAAFQRAVDIWAGLVSSPRPIRIRATFAALSPGVLGSAGASCYHGNFSGAPVSNTWYPNALADRLSGNDIVGCTDGQLYELTAQFSSTANWYYGLDGATPSGRYDFVSVVLHEIAHGLGFAGFGDVTNGMGSVVDGFPSIYDRFAVSESGVSLVDGFTSPSAALATQLTHSYNPGNPRGPGVYFNGAATNLANGGLSARLYTVTPWNSGSSYSHLDETTYPPGHPDSLMTFQISSAESIHHPGNVALGMFKDMGWSTCPAALASTSASAAGGAPVGSVALTIESGCIWTAASYSSFLSITSATSGTGSTTVSYAVAANTTGASRQGTLRIGGVTFTVTQGASGNTVSASPATLRFTGVVNNGTLTNVTPPQQVTVSTTGTGTIAWTASASVPWLQVSPASGTGAGVVTVSVTGAGNALAGVGSSASGTVTISSANAGNTATTTVQLSLSATTASYAPPIGQVDTPAQGTTGMQGAIAMTGWAVDDVGVQQVRIFRQCLSIDIPAACQVLVGHNVVLLGQASVIAGARPDVEAQYPSYPAANAAGWGFLILSNLLPNIPAGNANGGGVGTFTLYAVATDAEGNHRLLGRTVNDVTPTTVTVANDTIAKPFGAIDTPGQGATVSGTVNNFGWVLTPDSNASADGTDILMPTAGTTINVIVDGASVGTATYNLCRGTVGNPVPSGTLCDDDVSSIFRAAGVYRNLDAGRGAIGLRTFSTTGLSNGLHTIQWGVTDSAGRSEGIGSRYFTVLNSAGDAWELRNSGTSELRHSGTSELRHSGTSELRNSGTSELRHPGTPAPVFGRTGFDLARAFVALGEIEGVPTIRVPEMGRVELQAEGAESVALVANGSLRDAPVGLSVDARTGTIAWSVGPGYLGRYRLEVQGAGLLVPEGRVIDVIVEPREVSAEPLRMYLDRAQVGEPGLSSSAWLGAGERFVRVEGWVLDPQAETGSGVGAVHVWARFRGPAVPESRGPEVPESRGPEVPGSRSSEVPVFLGVADLGVSRPDVAAAHGAQFDRAGFRFDGTLPGAGQWEITAYVWNVRTQRFEDARSAVVIVR